ncbi:hypothetical protein M9434_000167 [Picochlorum sp. BPE23]|nr:hypothetical protein M9434_000167 [Picochlorum sp. BPE23]
MSYQCHTTPNREVFLTQVQDKHEAMNCERRRDIDSLWIHSVDKAGDYSSHDTYGRIERSANAQRVRKDEFVSQWVEETLNQQSLEYVATPRARTMRTHRDDSHDDNDWRPSSCDTTPRRVSSRELMTPGWLSLEQDEKQLQSISSVQYMMMSFLGLAIVLLNLSM